MREENIYRLTQLKVSSLVRKCICGGPCWRFIASTEEVLCVNKKRTCPPVSVLCSVEDFTMAGTRRGKTRTEGFQAEEKHVCSSGFSRKPVSSEGMGTVDQSV